jgi:hypothetical protein
VRQVDGRELVFVELGGDLAAFAFAVCAQASFFDRILFYGQKHRGKFYVVTVQDGHGCWTVS